MWIRELFAGLLGFASGLAVAGGMFALLIALGVISRFAGKTHTAAYVIQTDGEQVVNFDVSAEAASALSLGDEVTIIYGGNEYAAVVTELSVQADETTGLFSVTAQPPGGSGNRPHRHRCQGARFHRQGG